MREVTHIIAEYISCRKGHELFTDVGKFSATITNSVAQSGLTAVGECIYKFSEGGLTGSIVLSESHLNIHTWPERDYYLNIDISVCNYESDNTQKAFALSKILKEIFDPLDVNERVVLGYRDFEDSKYTEYFAKDYGFFIKPNKVVHRESSPFQNVEIYETADMGRVLRIDNYFQTSERDEFLYHESLVHPGMTAHPNPKRVLVIGGGDGGTLEEALKHNTVEKAVMVEIDPVVVEVSKKHLTTINHFCMENDPRVTLIIDDGIKYIMETKEKFDVVILDLTDPIGPAKQLYTADFYQAIKNTFVDEHSVLELHTEYPFIYPDTFGRIHATLKQVFKEITQGFTFVPLYGQLMSFSFCSDKTNTLNLSPEVIKDRIESRKIRGLKLYNEEYHFGFQATPQYIRDILVQDHAPITLDSQLQEIEDNYNVKRGGVQG